EHVRQQIPRDIHCIDEKILILDADVNVRAENQQLLRQVLEVFTNACIPFERCDLLCHPPRVRANAQARRATLTALGTPYFQSQPSTDEAPASLRRGSYDRPPGSR